MSIVSRFSINKFEKGIGGEAFGCVHFCVNPVLERADRTDRGNTYISILQVYICVSNVEEDLQLHPVHLHTANCILTRSLTLVVRQRNFRLCRS